MPPILDVAIGTLFVFLLFSLVVSSLNEVILSSMDKRAAFLKEGLNELLQHRTNQGVAAHNLTVDNLLNHGLVNSLSRGTSDPSYIGPFTFSRAVLDLLCGNALDTAATLQAKAAEIKDAIAAIPNETLKQSLTTIYREAEGNLDAFKIGLENWFNRGMERVTGWYKRYTQKWLLGLAATLAIFCNVDSVHIIQSLSADPQLRASIVKQAGDYVGQAEKPADKPAGDEPTAKIDQFKRNLDALGGTGIPMGWSDASYNYLFKDPGHGGGAGELKDFGWNWSHVLTALFGWMLTAFAASLGAPFWFDLLQRFINLRANGRSPDEKQLGSKKAHVPAGAPAVEGAAH
jgi:hypothetical protein